FLIFSFGTIVFLKISFANNCVRETINPSDVDITAEITVTDNGAATTGGKISWNSTGIIWSGLMEIEGSSTAIPNIPPSPINGKIVAKLVQYIINFFISLFDLIAINLFPK